VVYDGSFEGFLSLVYELYYQKITPTSILKYHESSLFEEYTIISNEENAKKVLQALHVRFEKIHFQTILNIFMCDKSDFEMALLEYIVLGFKDQKQLGNINHSFVFTIANLQKELFRNYHKMSGFLRFEETEDGTLYAKLENKCNLVALLGKHFSKRLNNQNFIIHDIERSLAFVKNENFVGVQRVESFESPELSKNEEKFHTLWKTFFTSVSIESRQNKKLQRQLVPLLYRTYMNEFMN
jgi:probable DNA metabolism protein